MSSHSEHTSSGNHGSHGGSGSSSGATSLPSTHPFRQRYTLSDVWHAASTDIHFDYGFWLNVCLDILYEFVIRAFGKVLVVMAVVLITMLGFSGICIVLPELAPVHSLSYLLQAGMGLFVLYNIYFNYYLAASTSPGSPRDYIDAEGVTHSASAAKLQHSHSYQQCKKCCYPKPLRCHHCSICNSCVMRMDHHCPWLSNCVGLRNYRFFVSFLFWVTVGTSYLTFATLPLISRPGSLLFPRENTLSWRDVVDLFRPSKAQANNNPVQAAATTSSIFTVPSIYTKWKDELFKGQDIPVAAQEHQRRLLEDNTKTALLASGSSSLAEVQAARSRLRGHPQDQHHVRNKHAFLYMPHHSPKWYTTYLHFPNEPVTHFMIFSISIGVMLGVGFLFGFHVYLISTGYTTIELFSMSVNRLENEETPPNPFHKGALKNFQQLLGTDKWYVALLPRLNAAIPVEELRYFPIAAQPNQRQPNGGSHSNNNSGSGVASSPGMVTNRASHAYHHSGEEAV